MIPKRIHYCWFGENAQPKLVKKCIASWKQHLHEYEFCLWDETNFDVHSNQYVHEAYLNKKWAFVSDFARLQVLYEHGGIYLDTDVEVIKNLDSFLQYKAFGGFEEKQSILTGVIGAEKSHPWMKFLLGHYHDRNFIKADGTFDLTTNVKTVTQMSMRWGLQLNGLSQTLENDIHIFSQDFFSPKTYRTKKTTITENTYCIHHFAGSWKSYSLSGRLRKKMREMIGDERYGNCKLFLDKLIGKKR